MKNENNKTMVRFFWAGVLLFFLFLMVMLLGDDKKAFLLRENGPIETASALGYFFCLVFMFYKGGIDYVKRGHSFLILIIFFMLRELDFDKRFTTMGIFKSRFYLSLEVPVLEKIIGVIVIMILVYAFFSIVYPYIKNFRARVAHGSRVPWGVFLVFILLVLSKTFDGISRKIEALGFKITHQASQHFWVAEEILELGIPIMIFLTAMIYFEEKKLT